MPAAVIHQPELIDDDPRCEASTSEILGEWKRFRQLSKEHGGLLTSSQAAKILDVSNAQMGTWRARGRITGFVILGTCMVPAPEVLALLKERQEGIRQSGGRGMKAPSLAELARAAYEDTKE